VCDDFDYDLNRIGVQTLAYMPSSGRKKITSYVTDDMNGIQKVTSSFYRDLCPLLSVHSVHKYCDVIQLISL
jgi:hypothetical protein